VEQYVEFQFDRSKEPRENAMAFLAWLVSSMTLLHKKQDATQAYVRSLYEQVQRATAQQQGRPPAPPQQHPNVQQRPGVGLGDIARGAQWVAMNRDVITGIFRLFGAK
jgi:hypothetical protein